MSLLWGAPGSDLAPSCLIIIISSTEGLAEPALLTPEVDVASADLVES